MHIQEALILILTIKIHAMTLKPLQFEKTLLTICESFCGFYMKAFIIKTTVTFETTVTFDRVKQIEP